MEHYIFIYLICFDDFIYVHNNLQSPVRSEMTHVLINIYKHFLLILLSLNNNMSFAVVYYQKCFTH